MRRRFIQPYGENVMGVFLSKLKDRLIVVVDYFIKAVVLIFLGTIVVNGVLAHIYGV